VSLYAFLAGGFADDPGRAALETSSGRVWSWRRLDARAARLATLLAGLGAVAGDRVAVQVEKSPHALALYLACLRAGLVFLPLNPAYREAELEHIVADAEPAVWVVEREALAARRALGARLGVRATIALDPADRDDAGRAPPAVELAGESLAALLYTSGTTGRPKGVRLTHSNLIANARALVETWAFSRADTLLHALPLFHVHGLFVACHTVLASGARLLFLPRFEARAVMAALPGASVLMGVPTYYTRLLAEADFGHSLCGAVRAFISGSAPLSPQTFAEFEARTGHRIVERYGMTETGMNTSNPLAGARKPGTVGRPLPGVRVRVALEGGEPAAVGVAGEVEIRGPNVFPGYWRNPQATAAEFAADGYFRTGDLGRFDEDGYLTLVGRRKDLVISGGLNVYPQEVENALDALDGVRESAVIGVPHPDLGEAVTAVVVREHPDVTGEAIVAGLKTRLAGYKVPKRVHFVDALPRNAMGKVEKNRLRSSLVGVARDS